MWVHDRVGPLIVTITYYIINRAHASSDSSYRTQSEADVYQDPNEMHIAELLA